MDVRTTRLAPRFFPHEGRCGNARRFGPVVVGHPLTKPRVIGYKVPSGRLVARDGVTAYGLYPKGYQRMCKFVVQSIFSHKMWDRWVRPPRVATESSELFKHEKRAREHLLVEPLHVSYGPATRIPTSERVEDGRERVPGGLGAAESTKAHGPDHIYILKYVIDVSWTL